jgi:NAD+ synthase (glutamine-hydrolysing)
METMQSMRIGLAAVNQTPLDWHGNAARIRSAITLAYSQGVDILCFPELCITGYGCEDRFLHPDTSTRALAITQSLAEEIDETVVLVGLPIVYEGEQYNGVAVLHKGTIQGITLKCHLAREGIHYEPRWFTRWVRGQEVTLDTGSAWIPMGNLIYRLGMLDFAIEICEDAWVPNPQRPCNYYSNVPLIFNASASHFSMGKADIREGIVVNSSRDFECVYAYTNLVGCESGRAIYDGEMLVADRGTMVLRSDRLFLNDYKVSTFDLPVQPTGLEADVVMTLHRDQPKPRSAPPPLRIRTHASMEGSFTQAASLALLDYLRKARARGFTLSLSGGVDSTAVAVLVWIMANRIMVELGEKERQEKLAFLGPDVASPESAEELVGKLLTCVYQATRNSWPVTQEAAREVAKAIGAEFLYLDVDALVQGYSSMIGEALGESLTWETHDQALQNIQARVRGPGVWMLANIKNHLLLTTSNRSEVAVGYATMDGDTCGGLAPVAGVQKTFLRQWLRSMEQSGQQGIPALPVLALVNRQAPTAELRPAEKGQEDEKDLMPYEVLDQLERSLVSERLTPVKAFQLLQTRFPQFQTEALHAWTKKFCWLFTISQWKRERYAPSFHLDDRSLDPKTWARYPILAAPFTAELEDLAAYVSEQAQTPRAGLP